VSEKEAAPAARDTDEEQAGRGLTGGGPVGEGPIVPGSPSLENAAFVLLGVLVALAVVFRLVQLFG
jgi:hypothetical protein